MANPDKSEPENDDARPRKGARASLALALGLLAFGLLSLAAVVWVTLPGGQTASAPSAIGGAFRLTAQDGRAVTERDLLGRPSLVFFGFTHCPDICPTKLYEMTQMLERLGPDATRLNVVFVTVDPERDDIALMKSYLGSFHPRITGLTGSEEEVRTAMRAYRAFARKVPLEKGGYTMDHTATVYLMDRKGVFVSTFDVARAPEQVAADIRRYF
jgi:protein SCO1/2